jgi:hypothetical protein
VRAQSNASQVRSTGPDDRSPRSSGSGVVYVTIVAIVAVVLADLEPALIITAGR